MNTEPQIRSDEPSRKVRAQRIHRGLGRVLNAAEHLATRSGAEPCPLHPTFGLMVGRAPSGSNAPNGSSGSSGSSASSAGSGATVVMETRRSVGGSFRSLVIAAITGDDGCLRTATVIGLPARGSLLPIVGVDVIALRGGVSLVALDLAPTDADRWASRAAPVLRDLAARAGRALVPRPRPEFTAGTFSPLAIIAGARPGEDARALAAAVALLRAVGRMAAEPRAEVVSLAAARAADAAVRRWCRAELENRKEHDALARLFGAEPARAYLEDYLFAAAKEEQE